MKIVIDMNLSIAWALALQAAGFEAVHWSEVGAGDAADDEIISWARDNAAVVLTRDLDFAAAITRSSVGAPSVIQLRGGRVQLERDLPLVRRAVSLHRGSIEHGAIVTLEEGRIRVRVREKNSAN